MKRHPICNVSVPTGHWVLLSTLSTLRSKGASPTHLIILPNFRLGNSPMKTFQTRDGPRRSKRLQTVQTKTKPGQPSLLPPKTSSDTVNSGIIKEAPEVGSTDLYSGQYLVDYCYRNWSRWAQEAREEAKRLRTLEPPCSLTGPAGEESVQMLADRLTKVRT